MTIYVVVEDNEIIQGVFSSKEKAEAYVNSIPAYDRMYNKILEYTLDELPR